MLAKRVQINRRTVIRVAGSIHLALINDFATLWDIGLVVEYSSKLSKLYHASIKRWCLSGKEGLFWFEYICFYTFIYFTNRGQINSHLSESHLLTIWNFKKRCLFSTASHGDTLKIFNLMCPLLLTQKNRDRLLPPWTSHITWHTPFSDLTLLPLFLLLLFSAITTSGTFINLSINLSLWSHYSFTVKL